MKTTEKKRKPYKSKSGSPFRFRGFSPFFLRLRLITLNKLRIINNIHPAFNLFFYLLLRFFNSLPCCSVYCLQTVPNIYCCKKSFHLLGRFHCYRILFSEVTITVVNGRMSTLYVIDNVIFSFFLLLPS